MQNSDFIKNIFLSGLKSDGYDPTIRKVILLNILLLSSISILFVFSLYNISIAGRYALGVVDILGLFGSLYAFVDLRRGEGMERASFIATLNIFLLMLAVVYFARGEDFTLIWTMFLPIFAIFINGTKRGLFISALFYTIIFTLAYQGIGVWMDGSWNMASFLRLVAASTALSLVTYFFEKSFESDYEELEHNRAIEERYILELEKAVITDPLTELYNRRYLDVLFFEMFEKAESGGGLFALFVIDLDYFKFYNDTYGHIAGDTALQEVALAMKNRMRHESDSTFRIGGEEFCLLLIADELEKIQKSIEDIRQEVESLKIEHSKSESGFLTLSIGACIIDSYKKKDFDKMYKIADDALYRAKDEGRDCVRGADVISHL